MAGLTHADQGLTFEAAYDLLGGLDPADLHEWEEDLFQQTGQCLRFATREVSVVDTPEGGVCFRSLHFNDRFDVVQTCIALDAATGGPDHSLPPSLDSQAGTATQGLSLAVALHQISRGGDAAGGGRRIAVLGAGACSLPAFLHDALPGATIDAVELSPDVCAAARACFGVSALEGSARFTLHEACAFVWLAAAPPRSLDLIIVDMEARGLSLLGLGLSLAFALPLPFAWGSRRVLVHTRRTPAMPPHRPQTSRSQPKPETSRPHICHDERILTQPSPTHPT